MDFFRPEISLIISTYNNGKYIEKCLNSVREQSFKNYELIIINDHSTDNSDFLIKQFIAENDQIPCRYWINKKNYGWCYSHNKGIQAATGKYICFLDSDDTLHTDYLYSLYQEIVTKNTNFVFCGYDRFFESNSRKLEYTKNWQYPTYYNMNKLRFNYIIGKTHICHCATIYKKAFLLEYNLSYQQGCKRSGDTEFIMKVLFCSENFSVVNQSLYFYNIHPDSITTQYPSFNSLDSYYTYERIRKNIKNPLWKLLFVCTKEARRISALVEEFASYNKKFPYDFCPKYKVLGYLLMNTAIKRNKQSVSTLKYYWKNYIKKV